VISDVDKSERQHAHSVETQQWMSLYQIYLIVGLAVLEPPGLLNIFAFSQTGSVISLGVSAIIIARLLTWIPTRRRVADWIERRALLSDPGR